MDKFFSPSKWFVGFCGLFVCIFFALKYVHECHMQEIARVVATDMFSYSWPTSGINIVCDINEAKVLKADTNDAEVMVQGTQKIERSSGDTSTSSCRALLKLYRANDKWFVGAMEAQ